MSQQSILDKAKTLIDSYHGLPHPAELATLWELRRNLTVERYNLSQLVKASYEGKALSYVMRKYNIAREMAAALELDRKAGGKLRPLSTIQAEVDALDSTFRDQKVQVEKEAAWEELIETSKAIEKILFSMSQEISDGVKERNYQQHSEGLQANQTEY